jgi:hypothetical protein
VKNRQTTPVNALETDLLEAGEHSQHAVLAQPDMLDLQAAASLSGLDAAQVVQMAQEGQFLALRIGAGEPRFPAFQFEPAVLPSIPLVISAFGASRAWQAHDFLTHPEPLLEGAVPLDLLRNGQSAAVASVTQTAAGLGHGAY